MADAPWKSEAIRERAAKAIHQESVAHPWEVLSDVQREPWRNRADAVLDAVGQVLYDQGRQDGSDDGIRQAVWLIESVPGIPFEIRQAVIASLQSRIGKVRDA